MKNLFRLLLASIVAGTVVAVAPSVAGAGPGTTFCTGELQPGSYGRVVVPSGAFCFTDGPVTISSGLWIFSKATLLIGSEESSPFTATIDGGVHGFNPASVQIHFADISGGVTVLGGSGPFGGPFDITWNAIEDNVIDGGATVVGYNGFWFGFIRNDVTGDVHLHANVLLDPDANEYVTNTIDGSLFCIGNSPAPQIGDSEGSPNVVTGAKTGQCAGL